MSSSPAPTASPRLGLLCLAVAVIGWGLNWPGIKLLVREWPPLFARGTAGLVGGALLAAYAAYAGERLSVPREALRPLLRGAFTNVFAWMGFPTVALLWLGVAEAALLVYTMPIWATLLAWPILGARPTARTLVALGLSFSGVALMLAGSGLSIGAEKLPGIGLILAAAVIFALGTVTSRTPLPMPPISSTAWQVLLGCAPMVMLGLVFEREGIGPLSTAAWIAWVAMAVGPMAICYLGWFAALRHLPPATAAMGTLVIPIIGALSAAAAIGEAFGLRQALAMMLTLSGVALALRQAARPVDRPGLGR